MYLGTLTYPFTHIKIKRGKGYPSGGDIGQLLSAFSRLRPTFPSWSCNLEYSSVLAPKKHHPRAPLSPCFVRHFRAAILTLTSAFYAPCTQLRHQRHLRNRSGLGPTLTETATHRAGFEPDRRRHSPYSPMSGLIGWGGQNPGHVGISILPYACVDQYVIDA